MWRAQITTMTLSTTTASLIALLIASFALPCLPNIHRAAKKTSWSTTHSTDPSSSSSHQHLDPDTMDASQQYNNSNNIQDKHKLFQAQICSVIAALVVGLTGILPLLVIPLEAGPNLKHGGKFHCLFLSFFVALYAYLTADMVKSTEPFFKKKANCGAKSTNLKKKFVSGNYHIIKEALGLLSGTVLSRKKPLCTHIPKLSTF